MNNAKSFEYYSTRLYDTAIYKGRGMIAGLCYVSLKLNGEAGEVAEKVGKLLRDTELEMDMPNNLISPQKREALIAELGDVIWYINAACHELDIPLRDIFERNLKKLEDRRDRNALSGEGDNR